MQIDLDLSALFSVLWCVLLLVFVAAIGALLDKILHRLDAMDVALRRTGTKA